MRAVLWKPPLHLATAGFCERCSSKDVVALVCVYDFVCTAGIRPWIVGYHGWPEPLEVVSPCLRGTRLLFPNR